MKRFILVTLGVVIIAFALHMFLIPANLAVGGVTGLGMIINEYFPGVNLGVLMIIFNLVLFVIGFVLVGKEFTGYTIYASFALSFLVGFLEAQLPLKNYFPNNVLMNLIYGILVQGTGMAIIFYQNASTGGTDIIAKVVNKYSHMEIGKALLISDAIISVLAGITFNAQLGMYAFLGILANGLMIDKVIAGFNTKVHVYVISEKNEEISRYIIHHMDRSGTFLSGKGMFTQLPKQVISLVVTKREYLEFKKHINKIDPSAFVIMNYVHDVLGEGFTYAGDKEVS